MADEKKRKKVKEKGFFKSNLAIEPGRVIGYNKG